MDVSSPAVLELHLVLVVLGLQGSTLGQDDCLQKLGHPLVEVACGSEHIAPDELMVAFLHVLLDELLKRLPLSITRPGLVLIDHLTLLVGDDLNVDAVAFFQQDGGKVCWPPEICTGEGEEHMEGPKVVDQRQEFVLGRKPVAWGVWNSLQHAVGIVQFEGDSAVLGDFLVTSGSHGTNVPEDPLLLKVGNCIVQPGCTS